MPEQDQVHPWKLPDADAHRFSYLCGVIRPPGWQRIGRTLPTLAQAAPGLVAAADPKLSVLLYKCWTEIFADYPDYPAQQIGDCVSFGHAHALDLLDTVECYVGELDISAIRRHCTEFIYGMARKISGDLGPFDGSYGGAAVKALTTAGYLSYGEMGDLGEPTTYSGRRAKQYGRTGPTPQEEELAGTHKLQAAALLESTDDLIAALQNGHPCTICTERGFSMQRDKQGFCKMQGRWGHCMFISAYRADRPGGLVMQSWGPDQPTGPTDLDQPSWSFWAELGDLARIIAEGDSWALSGSPGFPKKALPPELLAA